MIIKPFDLGIKKLSRCKYKITSKKELEGLSPEKIH